MLLKRLPLLIGSDPEFEINRAKYGERLGCETAQNEVLAWRNLFVWLEKCFKQMHEQKLQHCALSTEVHFSVNYRQLQTITHHHLYGILGALPDIDTVPCSAAYKGGTTTILCRKNHRTYPNSRRHQTPHKYLSLTIQSSIHFAYLHTKKNSHIISIRQ